jgi:hypothetical protein
MEGREQEVTRSKRLRKSRDSESQKTFAAFCGIRCDVEKECGVLNLPTAVNMNIAYENGGKITEI